VNFIFSNKKPLVLLIFAIVSFISFLFISPHNHGFFLYANFGYLFVLLFPVILGIKVSYLFFSCFLR